MSEADPMCISKACESFAAVVVYWPGRDSAPMCPWCAVRALAVAEAMGFRLPLSKLSPEPRWLGDLRAALAPNRFALLEVDE